MASNSPYWMEPDINFNEKYERMKEITGTKTQAELADALDIFQSSISDAKRRGSIPAAWYLLLFRKYGINPNWIDNPKESKYIIRLPIEQNIDENFDTPENKIIMVYSTSISDEDFYYSKYAPFKEITLPDDLYVKNIIVFYYKDEDIIHKIKENSYIGIDATKKECKKGGIFAVFTPGNGIILREVCLIENETMILLYHPNDINKNYVMNRRLFERNVIGELIWSIQIYK